MLRRGADRRLDAGSRRTVASSTRAAKDYAVVQGPPIRVALCDCSPQEVRSTAGNLGSEYAGELSA